MPRLGAEMEEGVIAALTEMEAMRKEFKGKYSKLCRQVKRLDIQTLYTQEAAYMLIENFKNLSQGSRRI